MTIGALKSVSLVSIHDPERASIIAINCSRQCRFVLSAPFAVTDDTCRIFVINHFANLHNDLCDADADIFWR